jgi:hypothetical protein
MEVRHLRRGPMPLAERNANRILVNSQIRECWCHDRTGRGLDLEEVAPLHTQPLGGLGVKLDP